MTDNIISYLDRNLIFLNRVINKNELKQIIAFFFQKYGITVATKVADELKTLGFHYATKAGLSLSLEDLKVPVLKRELIDNTDYQIQQTENKYLRGEITIVERLQKVVDTWNNASEDLKNELVNYFIHRDPLNPIYMMAFSGARGNISQVRQLVGMRGLMADPQGQIIDLPIKSNFREGLNSTEYIISSYGARKGIVDIALRTADSGYLTRRLVDVAQDYIIKSRDCGTKQGIYLTDLKDNDRVIIPLEKRLIGRVLAEQIYDVYTQEIIANYNQDISPKLAEKIVALGIKEVFIRSPLTCESKQGVCQLCYGWNLAYNKIADIGEAVGIIAAQSIGEPGTQLTMRTFHTGGVFTGQLAKQIRAPFEGRILPFGLKKTSLTRTRYGDKALLIEDNVTITIQSDSNVKESFELKPGVILFVTSNQLVKKNDLIAEFPLSSRLITENANKRVITDLSGEVYFSNLIVEEKIDLNQDKNEYIKRITRNDGTICILAGEIYNLPLDSKINVHKAEYIHKGQSLATLELVSQFGGKLHKLYNSQFEEDINAELAHASILYDGIETLYVDKSNINEQYIFQTVNNRKFILKTNPGNYIYNNRFEIFGEEILDKYRTETGGIIKYDTIKTSKRIKDNEGYELLEEGTLFWIPEITYELNIDHSLLKVKNGEFIKSSHLITDQISAPYDGIIEIIKKHNMVKEVILKIGTLYPIKDDKLVKIIKKQNKQIIYKDNFLFQIFNIKHIDIAFIEIYEYSSTNYLLIRHAYPYEIKKNTENFFSIQRFSQEITSLLIFNKIYLRYKDGQRIKSLTGINLVKNIWICKLQSNFSYFKINFELIKNKIGKINKLEIVFLEHISLKKQNSIKSNKNLTSTKILVDLKQILNASDIIAQTDILCKEDGQVLNIKTDKIHRILILTEKDKKSYINNSTKWNVKKGDWIKAGDYISDNVIAKESGQVLECNNNSIIVRKGKVYLISIGTVLLIKNQDFIQKGDTIAVLSYERFKTADIVQGLPKVEEILEARRVKEQILLSKDCGHLYFEELKNILWIFDYNNLKALTRQNLLDSEVDKLQLAYMSYVNLADSIIDGSYNTHLLLDLYFEFFIKHVVGYLPQQRDICVELSFRKIQNSLINEIQYVYQSQGADISDKHIEVIIRKMTSKVEMTSCEMDEIYTGELINLAQIKSMNLGINLLEKLQFKKEVKKRREKKKRKEEEKREFNKEYSEDELYVQLKERENEEVLSFDYKPILLGITKASLTTKSFISAASFQETRRVLTKAAFENHIDWLKALKENVIIGRLIPAGTGFKQFYLYEYTKKNSEQNIISINPYNFEDNIIYKLLTNKLEKNKKLN
nr:RNA polymerase beta' subunit [Galdieria sulphuraria]AIG92557.1 RNA polymerase beta' subunit [Galdieria sulphuraria]